MAIKKSTALPRGVLQPLVGHTTTTTRAPQRMEHPTRRSGRFDWEACNNGDLAVLLASRVISAANGSLSHAFELACVSKEFAAAVKTQVKTELVSLQSLYEDYRKHLLIYHNCKDGMSTDEPQKVILKNALQQRVENFQSKFMKLMNSYPMDNTYGLLVEITFFQKLQKEASGHPNSNNLVQTKFAFTFEDYTLAAHMCRKVCMLSSSMSTIDNWIARRGRVVMHWPFAQQERLACIQPSFYFKHTLSSSNVPPPSCEGCHKDFNNSQTEMRISLDALMMQYNENMGAVSRADAAHETLTNHTLGMYRRGSKLVKTEIPFFPSAFVPRENSVAGRLRLTDDQIKKAKQDLVRHKEALAEENRMIKSIRLRRFNEDASVWLRRKGHALTVEEVLCLLDADGKDYAKQRWEQAALPLIESLQFGHPLDNQQTFQQLKIMSRQLKLRNKIYELTGKLLSGTEMSELTMEPSSPPNIVNYDWLHVNLPVDDLAVGVEYVIHKVRSGEAKVELERISNGLFYNDLIWSIDLGKGFQIYQSVLKSDGEYNDKSLDASHIQRIFHQCKEHYELDVKPLSIDKICRAKELLCSSQKKRKYEKDWGYELIQSIVRLDRAVKEKSGSSNVIFQVFKVYWFTGIKTALQTLCCKWMSAQCSSLPHYGTCPLTTRDFVLKLIGNPLGLPTNCVPRPAPKKSPEERAAQEAKIQGVIAQIPEAETSSDDEDGEMDAEDRPSGYEPSSPEYSPTSASYEPA